MHKYFDYSKYKKYKLKYDYSKYDPNRLVIVIMKHLENQGYDDVGTAIYCRKLTERLFFPTNVHILLWADEFFKEDQLSSIVSEFGLTVQDVNQLKRMILALHTPYIKSKA